MTDSGVPLAANTTRLDNQDPDRDWGRPETGRTHIFNSSLIWMLSSLEGKSGLMRAAFGDWEITGIVGAGTGQPLSVFTSTLPNLIGGPSGTGFNDNQVPNRVSSEPCHATSGPDEQIINPAAFTLNGFRLGQLGNAKRGDCTGPGYFQTDLAFYKNFPLKHGMKFQFRWDIFNVFNNTNFLFQNLNFIMNPTAITLNSARTEILSSTIPGSFGQATRTRDPRQMQIGFKLLW
jgi:hypothetical protein